MARKNATTAKRKSPMSPESDPHPESNPNPNPITSGSQYEIRAKSSRDPKSKTKYPTDKFLNAKTEELYHSYVSISIVPTRYIKFLDFSLAKYPLSELLQASGLYDIWNREKFSPYCPDSVKQFHCNKHFLTNDEESLVTSYVNGTKIALNVSHLHSIFNIPKEGRDLSKVEMDDSEVLKRMCLAPPPLLNSALKKAKMTNIAKILATIISWNLIVRRGSQDQPSFLQTQAVYSLLAGLHVNWAEEILKNLGTTDVLGHTLVITHVLDHFKVHNSVTSTLTTPSDHFDNKSLSLMFKVRRPYAGTSSSHPSEDTPIFTDEHTETQPPPPPPPPRSVSEERFQILEARITSLADEIGHVRTHQRATRLTMESYFNYLSSQLHCLISTNGVQFPAYSCPSFFPTFSFEEQFGDILRNLPEDIPAGDHAPQTGASDAPPPTGASGGDVMDSDSLRASTSQGGGDIHADP